MDASRYHSNWYPETKRGWVIVPTLESLVVTFSCWFSFYSPVELIPHVSLMSYVTKLTCTTEKTKKKKERCKFYLLQLLPLSVLLAMSSCLVLHSEPDISFTPGESDSLEALSIFMAMFSISLGCSTGSDCEVEHNGCELM